MARGRGDFLARSDVSPAAKQPSLRLGGHGQSLEMGWGRGLGGGGEGVGGGGEGGGREGWWGGGV